MVEATESSLAALWRDCPMDDVHQRQGWIVFKIFVSLADCSSKNHTQFAGAWTILSKSLKHMSPSGIGNWWYLPRYARDCGSVWTGGCVPTRSIVRFHASVLWTIRLTHPVVILSWKMKTRSDYLHSVSLSVTVVGWWVRGLSQTHFAHPLMSSATKIERGCLHDVAMPVSVV